MTFDRRQLMGLGAGLGLGVSLVARSSPAAGQRNEINRASSGGVDASTFGVFPNMGKPVSAPLQSAINAASLSAQPLFLRAGTYNISAISVPARCHLIGVPGATVLQFDGGSSFLTTANTSNIRLEGLVLDGAHHPMDTARTSGLFNAYGSTDLQLRDLTVRNSLLNGLSLRKCAGSIKDCAIAHIFQTGIFSIDANGMELSHNNISDCDNNGIQVWKSSKGEDGTIVIGNRIMRVKSASGGTGQNGNGINIYRAGSVLVSSNRITDCAYSAVRGNAVSNMQIIGNSCERIGEVALYAEFGFDGAMIANNLVDGAASGIAATNLNEGGHLAMIQGNILRNFSRREFEPQDKRGNGIGVEADAVVSGNVIENAATSGIMIGWGKYMRDVTATSNLIRKTPLGIGITAHRDAGSCFVGHNMISGTSIGAIRAMNHARPIGSELAHLNTSEVMSNAALANIRLMGNMAT